MKTSDITPQEYWLGIFLVSLSITLLFVGSWGIPKGVSAQGNVYYVAPTGSDSNPGTEAQPWQTIQKAADSLVAGDTVYIRAGTYQEQVIPQDSGSAGNYITYAAYPGETVTIDGNSITLPAYETGLFVVEDVSYVRVSGLRMINAGPNDNNAGIYVDNSHHIIIENNYTYNTVSSGIGVWNGNNIIIDSNEVELACNDGEQEDITVAGTDTFEIKNNHIHDGGPGTNGGEGITVKDGARNGKVYRNHVHDIIYGERTCLYVDAWDKETYNIEVYQNILHNCAAGISLASENGGLLRDVKIYNNIVYDNISNGLEIGNWGEPWISMRPIQNATFINNTVYSNGNVWGGGFFNENPDAKNIVIRNNIFSQNLLAQILDEAGLSAANLTVDHNLIDGYREDPYETRGSDYVEGEPMFVNVAGADFHLQKDSPAVDKGSSVDAPNDDFEGNSRPQDGDEDGTAIHDIGAYEVSLLGVPPPVTAPEDNPNPPDQVVKLVFIHHSTGENWLTDDYGGLGIALGNNNYFVSDTNYGWGPNSIGDRTDILNWPEWFNSPESGMYLDALYNLSEQNSWYTRQLADPGGENQIIMFKSCFPNSDLEGSPGDPPSDDDYLTVGSAKRVYIGLLSYFATRQDKLFVAITAPPLLDPTHSANARAFNNWLLHDWLRDYPHRNVAVFDFYNILTGPDNHHRFYNGTIEHVTMGGDTLYYPTNGDEHPNPAGSQKATGEFVPLLNVYYHRWQAGGPPSQPAPTQAPAVEEPAAKAPATEEQAQPARPPTEAGLVDGFEDVYELDQGWEMWVDEQTDSSLAFALDNEVAHSGSASLRIEFDIAPEGSADVSRSFDPAQDWSGGTGLAMWLRFSEATEGDQEISVILDSGEPEAPTPFEAWLEISPESADPSEWILIELPWDRFPKADWADEGGLSELDPSRVAGISLSFGAPDDSRVESIAWVDDIRLLGETPQPAPTEAAPVAAATATAAPMTAAPTPPEEEEESRGLCPISMGLALTGLALTRKSKARPE